MITAWRLIGLVLILLWFLLLILYAGVGLYGSMGELDWDDLFYESVCFIVSEKIIMRLLDVVLEHKAVLSSYIIF